MIPLYFVTEAKIYNGEAKWRNVYNDSNLESYIYQGNLYSIQFNSIQFKILISNVVSKSSIYIT